MFSNCLFYCGSVSEPDECATALGDAVKDARVLREARNWTPPSDHAPVTVTLDI